MNIDSPRQHFQRKQYIVAPKFQMKYVGLILLLMFLTAALCSYVIYYTMMILMGEKLASVYPQGRLMAIVRAVNWRIMISIFLISPLVAVAGIFLSHKIAGPIYRIEKFLTSIAGGDVSARLTLRKGDEFGVIADGINKVIDSLRVTVAAQRAHIAKASSELDTLEKLISDKTKNESAIAASVTRLDTEVISLTKELEKYKV